MTDYTDPGQAMKWGNRSHWMQPWRSYMDTVPATTLLDAVGINFNVSQKEVASTAELLGNSGFKRARIEVGWGTLDYDDPTQMSESSRQSLVKTLTAMRDNGIRPLILLNANHGKPCPITRDTIELTTAGTKGDTTLSVAPADVDKIVPGRTGITNNGIAAEDLFASVDPDGLAHLSKPLYADVPAGSLPVTTLRYEPFRPATLEDGSPNPRFEPTMQGWLNYVGVVTREVKSILGSEEFDVEVWNELSFGSRFLNINGYYEPDIEWANFKNFKPILFGTVDYLRNPAHGVPNIGIGNGFANQSPWWNGTESPVGLTAIDKHPYAGWDSFPLEAQVNGNRPLNGVGELTGWKDDDNHYHEFFTPTYDDFFPEHFLSGIQTETLIHDLSPRISTIARVEHGRSTHPEGGAPPAMWITEVNLGPGRGPTPATSMSAADIRHIESKVVLRYLAAYVNKGVTALDFYAASGGELSLVDQGFFSSIKSNPTTYPGDSAGGETTDAVRRLTDSMAGAQTISSHRTLSLGKLTDYSSNVQFEGNGTAEYPPLYNREVFAFFPFQVNQRRFVIPVYVMTRNVAKIYPGAPSTDPHRFDLPPERYGMTIGGIDGESTHVSATDPLTGNSIPVEVVARSSDQVEVEMGVTDSPRLLTVEEDEAGQELPSEEEGGEGEEEPPLGEEEAPTEEEEGGGKSPARHALERAPSDSPGAGTWASPYLHLRGSRALLQTRRLVIFTKCGSRCPLSVKGRFSVGPRSYRMIVSPRGSRLTQMGSVRTTFDLSISDRATKLGRFALRRRTPVRVALVVQARPDSGGLQIARHVVALRKPDRHHAARGGSVSLHQRHRVLRSHPRGSVIPRS